MTGAPGPPPAEALDEAECRRLLEGKRLGRLVLTSGALPAVIPVVYALDAEHIVVRVSPAWHLRTSLQGAVVAFEVDELDPATSAGWSIVAVGVAQELAADHPGRPADGGGDQIVGILPTALSGHRVTLGAPGTGNPP